MNDLDISSNDVEEGINKLKRVLEVLPAYGLEINLKKFQFFKRKIEF